VQSARRFWRPAALVVIFSLFLLSGCEQGGADAEIKQKLEAQGRSKGSVLPDREDYYGVFVLDENNAWAVGNRGVVLHITDKGEKVTFLPTWVEKALYNVDFIDTQNGLAVGQDGLIVKTSDGGKTWKQVKFEVPLLEWQVAQPHVFSMSRGTDLNKVWAVGPVGLIIYSQNGGETWESLSLGRDVTLNGVAFANDTEGWVAGEFGTILHTTDGGRTWQEQKNVHNLPKYTRPDLSEEDAIRQRVPPLYLEDLFLVSVAARNAREAYVTGESGILLKTEDGGETWTNVSSGSFNTLLSVSLASSGQRSDVATGVLGTLATGSNGEWRNLPDVREHVLTWIRDVSFAKGGNFGLACGGKGTILVTHDGGKTWQLLAKEKLAQAGASAEKAS
jgi:photosystem II stability/assembly factor-like uncharacterized protein